MSNFEGLFQQNGFIIKFKNKAQRFIPSVKTLIEGIKFLLTVHECIIYLSETFAFKQQTLTARFCLNFIDIFLIGISYILDITNHGL